MEAPGLTLARRRRSPYQEQMTNRPPRRRFGQEIPLRWEFFVIAVPLLYPFALLQRSLGFLQALIILGVAGYVLFIPWTLARRALRQPAAEALDAWPYLLAGLGALCLVEPFADHLMTWPRLAVVVPILYVWCLGAHLLALRRAPSTPRRPRRATSLLIAALGVGFLSAVFLPHGAAASTRDAIAALFSLFGLLIVGLGLLATAVLRLAPRKPDARDAGPA